MGANSSDSWRCYKCGKEGYIKRDCPSIKKKYKAHKAKSVVYKDKEDTFEGAFVVNESCKSDAQQEEWLIDSGASKHMTWNKEALQNYQEFSEPQTVKLGYGRVVEALGLGNITMKMSFRVSDGKDAVCSEIINEPFLSGSCCQEGKHSEVQKDSLLHKREEWSSPWNGNTEI